MNSILIVSPHLFEEYNHDKSSLCELSPRLSIGTVPSIPISTPSIFNKYHPSAKFSPPFPNPKLPRHEFRALRLLGFLEIVDGPYFQACRSSHSVKVSPGIFRADRNLPKVGQYALMQR